MTILNKKINLVIIKLLDAYILQVQLVSEQVLKICKLSFPLVMPNENVFAKILKAIAILGYYVDILI